MVFLESHILWLLKRGRINAIMSATLCDEVEIKFLILASSGKTLRAGIHSFFFFLFSPA